MDKVQEPMVEKEVEFRTSRYRWVILVGCMLSIMVSTLSVATLSPVAIQIAQAYHIRSVTVVNMCAISFSLCSAPFTVLSIMAYRRYEMSKVMRIASFFQLAGMLIRDLSIPNDAFWPLLAGVLLQSSASPFFLNSQAQVANRWFSDS